MTLSVAAILLAVSAAVLALIVVCCLSRGAGGAFLAAPAAPDLHPAATPADPVVEATEAISARVAALLQDHERRMTDAFSHVREDLSGLNSDVEWLAGERMIEQAIALAQTGSDAEEIGQELGLSRDQAATIALFRKH